MDGQNLTSQNAPGSTIGNLEGVLLPPPTRMLIFAFIGQPACYSVCHCNDRWYCSWKAKAFRYNLCFVADSKCSGDL